MKIRMTFKTPDVAQDAMREAADQEAANALEAANPIDPRELTELATELYFDASNCASKWIRYGEYVTIEIDTETKTATVVPV